MTQLTTQAAQSMAAAIRHETAAATAARTTAPSPGAASVQSKKRWLLSGWGCVFAAALFIYCFPAASHSLQATVCTAVTSNCASAGATQSGTGTFQLADGFASLAGFTFLAAALERLAEFALAPWWGKVHGLGVTGAAALQAHRNDALTKALKVSASAEQLVVSSPDDVGVTAEQTKRQADIERTEAARASNVADSIYVTATKQRPTIMLPMAAAAATICAGLHLLLLHSLAKSGLPNTRWAYFGDAMLTGFALAGGAQPFHDLVTTLTTSSSQTAGQAASTSTS